MRYHTSEVRASRGDTRLGKSEYEYSVFHRSSIRVNEYSTHTCARTLAHPSLPLPLPLPHTHTRNACFNSNMRYDAVWHNATFGSIRWRRQGAAIELMSH